MDGDILIGEEIAGAISGPETGTPAGILSEAAIENAVSLPQPDLPAGEMGLPTIEELVEQGEPAFMWSLPEDYNWHLFFLPQLDLPHLTEQPR